MKESSWAESASPSTPGTSRSTAAAQVRQRVWMVAGTHKLDALTRILEVETFDGMIIFVRTKMATVDLAERLSARGFDAAAIHGDLVIFGTLDARIVALNKDTGKVKWRKKIADYKAGYSYTAAPLIVNGLVITGNSGGEFGIVGAVQARCRRMTWRLPLCRLRLNRFLAGSESRPCGFFFWRAAAYRRLSLRAQRQ